MTKYEEKYIKKGYVNIIGIDEAGRGPIAGPVVAASVLLKKDYKYSYINDSKKLTERQRNIAYEDIMKNAIVGIGIINNKIIDKVNILEATKLAMLKSIENINVIPEIVLIDAVKINTNYETLSIIKGDQKSISIAAASIIAKVTRDNIMKEYGLKYPLYLFEKHKGYPTKQHKELVEIYGACSIHRKTFAPIKYLK